MRCPATPGGASALARLEARVALADHEDLATATHDLAVAVTGLRRFQGGQDLHDIPLKTIGTSKPAILMGIPPPIQALARFFSDAPRAPVGVQSIECREYRRHGEKRMTAGEVPVLTLDGPSGPGKGGWGEHRH